ncbi:MAG TPA: hypothetical protein VH879_07030 [Gemmatimonadales bacterium]|jgi:hypothetical protein
MGLPVLVLAQALASLAPTIDNTSLLAPVVRGATLPAATDTGGSLAAIPDTVRTHAVQLSDGYYTRLDIHRYAGYAMLPLFAIELIAGQKLLEKGSAAPLWAEKVHKPAAYLVAGVFTLNTVTGLMNLAEANKVPQGRKRRWVHSVMMLAADAGLIYGVSVAPSTAKIDARIASGKRGGWTPHKISTVASMGVATFSYLMMYVWKEKE